MHSVGYQPRKRTEKEYKEKHKNHLYRVGFFYAAGTTRFFWLS
jgi:hypothetical protein